MILISLYKNSMYRLSRNELFCWVVKVFFIFQLKNKILKGSLYLYSYFQNLWLYCVNQARRDLNDFYNQSNFFWINQSANQESKVPIREQSNFTNNLNKHIIPIYTLLVYLHTSFYTDHYLESYTSFQTWHNHK